MQTMMLFGKSFLIRHLLKMNLTIPVILQLHNTGFVNTPVCFTEFSHYLNSFYKKRLNQSVVSFVQKMKRG